MGKPKQDKNLRGDLSKEVSKIMKKQEREEKIWFAEAAKSHVVIKSKGSSMSISSSKIKRSLETSKKNLRDKKSSIEDFARDSYANEGNVYFIVDLGSTDVIWNLIM